MSSTSASRRASCSYEKADLWIGIVMVIIGAVAMMAFTAAAFDGKPEFGNFTDAGAVASGIGKYAGRAAGVMFAIALIDASIIGASAVSLSTAYAIGDVLSLKHSLHRKPTDAKGFYAVYCGLIVIAAGLVPHARRAARPADQCRADAGRRAAAERDGVPAAALQRQGGARSLGQRPLAQPLHRRRDRGAGDAVDHSDGLRHVSGRDQRDGHSCHSRRRRQSRRSRRACELCLVKGRAGKTATPVTEGRSRAPQQLAHAAAGKLAPAELSLAARTWMFVLRAYLVIAGGLVLVRIVTLTIGQG